MQNHRLLMGLVIFMGVLIFAAGGLMTVFAFKKMKASPVSFQIAAPIALGPVTIEHMSASHPHIYLLTKDKTSGASKITIIDAATQAKVGDIDLETR